MLRFPRTSPSRVVRPSAQLLQRKKDARLLLPGCREKLKGVGHVAVVGGGLAGLMAARRLVLHGVKVTVYEARKEVGGRVLSNPNFSAGRITEEGAELIGSFHTEWLELAREFGLAMISRMEPELYEREGLDVQLILHKRLTRAEFKELAKQMDNRVLTPLAEVAELIQDPSQPWKQKLLNWRNRDWLMTTLDNMSVQEALPNFCQISKRKENPTDEPLWQMLDFKLVNDEVAPLDEMNFLGLLCKVRGGQGERFTPDPPRDKGLLHGYWEELEIFRCADGCQTLAKRIAEKIQTNKYGPKPAEVKTLRAVTRIALSKTGVTLGLKATRDDGKFVDDKPPLPIPGFSYVILAIPPSVWPRVAITADGQDADPAKVIGQMRMNDAVKYFSDLDKRFWIEKKAAPYGGTLRLGQVWEGTDNQTRVGKQGILLSVFAGPVSASRRAPTRDDFDRELRRLYPYDYGDYAKHLTKKPPLLADWPNEAFIKAGYWTPYPGEIFRVGEKLSKPYHDRLFFAGEHTQMDFFGYMEGALRSGERAAETLLLKACGLLDVPAPTAPSRPPQKPAPKPSSPPLVARAAPTRETAAFEHESGISLQQQSSPGDPGEAESPFLHQELFAKGSEELEPRAAALVAESPFQAAFVEEPEIPVEPELEEASELGEELLAEKEFESHYPHSEEPGQVEGEEPRQGVIPQAEVEESDEFLEGFHQDTSQEEETITESGDNEPEIENLGELSDTLEAEVPKEEEGQSEAYSDLELDEELRAQTGDEKGEDFSEVKEEAGDVEIEPFEFQTAIPPRGLKLTEHFHVPKSLPDGRSGALTRLAQQSMNPGFVSVITDDLLVDRRADGLQTRLDDLIKTKYARFLATRSATQEGARVADRIRVALVDLTGGKLFRPDFAGWGSIFATDGASVPKICALYAVHQLQSDLNHLAVTKSITRREDLIRAARAAWQKTGFASMPRLDELFMFVVFEGVSRPVSVSFSPDLLGTLTQAFKDNNNCAVDRLISQLGFPYIASVIWQSGLRHPTRGGLWLWGGYCCTDITGIRRLLNVDTRAIECTVRNPKDGLSFRWKANSVQQPKPVFAHNATAVSVATFFTLLTQGRLINEQASDKIARTLQDACSFLWDGQLGGLRLHPPPSKCGDVGALTHDGVLIKRTEGVKEIHYAAVALTIGARDFRFPDFLKDVDQLIQDKN